MTGNGIARRIKAQWRLKVVLSVALTSGFTAIYLLLQRYPQFSVSRLPLTWIDRRIPFHPGAIYLYQTLWLIMPIGPWLMRTRLELAHYTARFVLIAVAGFCVFLFWPTSNPRPEDLSKANALYRAVAQVDLGLNSFPSHHVALAVFSGLCCCAALSGGKWRNGVYCLIWIWVLAIIVATLLTKQHYFVDVVAGAALGFVGYAAGGLVRIHRVANGAEMVSLKGKALEMDPNLASSSRSRVAVASCASYAPGDVAAALAEAVDAIGGLVEVIQPGQTVLLNPNLFSPHVPDDAVTTHPEIVRQTVRLCFEAGAGRVWVGDSPVGSHQESQLWSRTGMTQAVADSGAELKSWQGKQTALDCDGDMLAVPAWFQDVDVVISLPKLKTHCLTTLTCGMKNVYGLVSGLAKTQFHTKYPSPLAMSEFLVRVFARLQPQLTIADAVVAMEGNGPAHGRPVKIGVLLCSRDAVALDAVASQALRISPAAVPMIRLAAARGLGRMDEAGIECVGSGVEALRSARMKPSLARVLKRLPEWAFGTRLRPLRMRPKIRARLCHQCGACAEACPTGAIHNHSRTGLPGIDRTVCIDCFCCLESCPESAIVARFYLGKHLWIGQKTRARSGAS